MDIEAILRAIREPTDAMLLAGAMNMSQSDWTDSEDVWKAMVDAALATLPTITEKFVDVSNLLGSEYISVPIEPSRGLLMSMAIRFDHGLGIPGYYDGYLVKTPGVTHAQRLESTLITMRQLYEEVVGKGHYSTDKEEEYCSRAINSLDGRSPVYEYLASMPEGAVEKELRRKMLSGGDNETE